MVPHRNFHFEDVPPIFGLAGQALELIPIPDENFWRAGCNWMIAGPDDINIQEILGLPFPVIVPGIVNWIIEELLAFFILDDEVLIGEGTWNYHSQTMLIDLMVAGNTDFYESWGDANESANDVAHGYDNWLMMQRFAMKTMHNNSNLLQNDFDWMRNVLCEYACPWPCYVQPGTTVPANFECNNQAGGYWDCGPLWGSKPLHLNCQGNTINYTSSFGNGIDYMLAYNQFQLAGGTSNQNYFNPFDYEITPENKDDLSNGYEGMNEVISVAESLTPCDRTVQYYHLVGEQFECPEFTTSDNLQILSTTHDMVQIRILSKKEKSWIIVEETCGNFDQCHLPKKIRIILEIKDKCDDACVTNSYEIVNITTNQTWGIDNSKSFIHATVYVHPNATLTLNNFTGFFDFAGGIQVERGAKLIVAESTLTKCPESVNWIGIRVAGNSELDQPDYTTTPTINQSGIVFLQNSTIENARFGIETSGAFGNYGSPLFNGGLVHCENSTFLNNDYGAIFNMYFKPNKSKMVGCTFKRNLTGATVGLGAYIDATSGIVFDKCSFSGMYNDGAGIRLINAGCNILNNCKFIGNSFGVESYASHPVSNGAPLKIIGNNGAWNEFKKNFIDIRSFSAASLYKDLQIEGNIFAQTKLDAIQLSGANSTIIHDNAFSNSDIGISTYSLGDNFNNWFCNNFNQSTGVGIFVEGNHSMTSFTKNEFETSTFDIVVGERPSTGEAGIVNSQGMLGQPANNCFSGGHPYNLLTSGNTLSFNYFIPNNNISNCTLPISTPGLNNYNLIQTYEIPGNDQCSFPDYEEIVIPITYNDYFIVQQELFLLQNQLVLNPNDLNLLSEYWLKMRKKDWMISHFIRQAIHNSEYLTTAETILNNENTTKAKRLLYGLKLQRNDLTGAASVLASIPIIDMDDFIFNQVQQINLSRLQDATPDFTLTPVQGQYLQDVALGYSSSKEYAMGLLKLLTGQNFTLEHTPVEILDGRSSENLTDSISKPVFSIFPNPSKGILSVILPNNTEEVEISIFSLGSFYLKSFKFANGQRFELDLKDLTSGLYFIRVKAGVEFIGFEKLMISK